MKTILSVDGGGARGVIPSTILDALEARTGRRTAELFDLIAGTSAGGIQTVMYTAPGDDGRPRYGAAEGTWMYMENQDELFSRSFWRDVTTLAGLTDERYDAASMERVLERYLGEATLADTCTRILISAYDLEQRRPFFFKSWRPEHGHISLVDVARATSAAPTYFPPKQVVVGGVTHALVDGGVFANNPAMCAYAEARRLWPDEELLLVSLGTGEAAKPIPYSDAKDWGLAEWAVPILKVVFDGVDNAVDYQLRRLMPTGYFRFQKVLTRASEDLDDTSLANIEALKAEAADILAEQAGDFSTVCAALLARKG